MTERENIILKKVGNHQVLKPLQCTRKKHSNGKRMAMTRNSLRINSVGMTVGRKFIKAGAGHP